MPIFRKIEPHETLVFLHIPKAAGSSLRGIMKEHYSSSQTHRVYGWRCQRKYDKFTAFPREKKKRIRYIEGHMRFGIHEYVPGPCAYMTFLRDPVQRLLSHYYYIFTRPNHYQYGLVVGNNMSFDEFIASDSSRDAHNRQVFSTAGLSAQEFSALEEPREALDMARRNIEKHFALVGFSEHFDTSLLLLKLAMGWDTFPFYVRRNVTKNTSSRSSVSASTIERIREYNSLDWQLYREMLQRFNATCHTMEGFEDEVAEFSRQNRIYQEKALKLTRLSASARFIGQKAVHIFRHALRIKRQFLDFSSR